MDNKELIKSDLDATLEVAQIPPSTVEELRSNFAAFYAEAMEWEKQSLAIKVTDEDDTENMSLARDLRLRGRAVRIEADKTRKRLKEDALRYGNAVQAVFNLIKEITVPTEKYLYEQETYRERVEQKRKEEKQSKRLQAITPYLPLVTPVNLETLASLPDPTWDFVLDRARKEHEQREAEALEAEKARIEAEAREAEERERREAERREALAKAEQERKARETAEAEVRRLREAKDALEQEKARKAAEERREAERLAAAPDNEKLLALADQLDTLELPGVSTDKARETVAGVRSLLGKVSGYIRGRVEV